MKTYYTRQVSQQESGEFVMTVRINVLEDIWTSPVVTLQATSWPAASTEADERMHALARALS